MPSMVVMVKINKPLWGVGRWARTLVIMASFCVFRLLHSIEGCCTANRRGHQSLHADREVARGRPARTHQRVVCIVMVDMGLVGSAVGTMTVNLVSIRSLIILSASFCASACVQCRRSKSFPQPCLATSDSAAQASTWSDRTSNHLSSRGCFTCYGQAR